MKGAGIPMQGGGFYNRNSSFQERAIDKYFEVFKPPKARGASITLADYGSSEGKNSIRLFQKILDKLPSISSATLIFNDLPLNDFCTLSSALCDRWSELSRNETLDIYPLMVPRSYLHQVLPDEFVNEGFSFTTLNWSNMAEDVDTRGDPSALAGVAHRDLVAFLSSRYKEFSPGGNLTLCIPCRGSLNMDSVLECVEATYPHLPTPFQTSSSSVPKLPLYFRSMDEVISGIEASKVRWSITEKMLVPIEHQSWTALMDGNSDTPTADASEKYAGDMASLIMAILSNFLLRQVKAPGEKKGGSVEAIGDQEFLDIFANRYRQEFLKSFKDARSGFTYAFVKLKKE